MAGELLGLVVVWALLFTLPVIVAWTTIRIVATARENLGKWRVAQHASVSHGDAYDATSAVAESEPDPDAHDTERDDGLFTATSTSREQP